MSTTYTREQVAQHNTEQDCWVILEGKVLDLSGFASDHPGRSAFMHAAGKDATEMMSKIHRGAGHSADAYVWTKSFVIGTLSE